MGERRHVLSGSVLWACHGMPARIAVTGLRNSCHRLRGPLAGYAYFNPDRAASQ
jgi:hypothetical protein